MLSINGLLHSWGNNWLYFADVHKMLINGKKEQVWNLFR